MLFRFQSKESPDVLMLSDLTEKIFKIIDKSFETKGIFLVEQLPDAIEKLEIAIEHDAEIRHANRENEIGIAIEKSNRDDRLGQRAYPFLKLLKDARDTQRVITWDVS